MTEHLLRRTNSRHARILTEISLGDYFVGFLSSARSTRLLHKVAHNRALERSRNKRTIEDLIKRGYLTRKNSGDGTCFLITAKGRLALREAGKETVCAVKHPEHWDGKWRILIYDFPEDARSIRNTLRYALDRIGFLLIQKSVWIFPYDTPLLAALLKEDKEIAAATILISDATIINDLAYRAHFRLPR